MCSSQRIISVALLLAVLLAKACVPSSTGSDIAQAPSPTPEVFIFPGPTEKILISTEDIPQNNCGGTAEVSQEVGRGHTVLRTLELGTGITVDAGGQAGIPGVGQVDIGVAVASYYQVSYGSQDAVARNVVVKAKEGTNILHTIRQYEIWETGELLIVAGGVNQRLPYRFRKDFSMEMLPPANIGCPGQGALSSVDTGSGAGQAEPVQPVIGTTLPPPTSTSEPLPPTNTPIPPQPTEPVSSTSFEVYASLSWQDTGVRLNPGDRVRVIWDGKSRWRGINSGDFSDPLGGYSDPNANYGCPPLMPSAEAGWNAMVAKVGEGGTVMNPFKVPPVGEGTLYLAMNDCDEQRYDNEGSAIVTIEVRPR